MSESANAVPGAVAVPEAVPYETSSRGLHVRVGLAMNRPSSLGEYEANPLVESHSWPRVTDSWSGSPGTYSVTLSVSSTVPCFTRP